MTKTLALLLDSYRELNAKRLFWIVLVVSALVVCAFALVGLKNGAITVLVWETPFKGPVLARLKPAMLYKLMFSFFGVGFWLTWLANILALVSTAGIFPEFMAGGSIDLYLSKPISRLRLFFTKYLGGLLFVTLQVTIFSFCSFLVVGLRGHDWEPAIFLSIPLVVLVFSYLFSICVLLGIMTKSTIASLLLTLLAWFVLWGVQTTESALMVASISNEVHAASLDQQISQTKADLSLFPTTAPADAIAPASAHRSRGGPLGFFEKHETRGDMETRLAALQTQRGEIGTAATTAHTFAYAAMYPLPKNKETIELLDRQLIKRADLPDTDANSSDGANSDMVESDPDGDPRFQRHEMRERVQAEEHRRSAAWILGTSLAFEAVVVSLAAWLFCRRDY